MSRKISELKKRCWLAKQRLKMGYWDSVSRPDTEEDNAQTFRSVSLIERAKYVLGEQEESAPSPRDERMYKIVCDILSSDEVTMNPIGRLIERDVYDELDSAAKQRYILELSEKFRELKERYYKEKTGA